MRTTVELPDPLFRQAKARAALQGRALKEVIAEGLQLLLRTPANATAAPHRTQFPIIKSKAKAPRLTAEMVAAAEEQMLAEEAAAHGRPARH